MVKDPKRTERRKRYKAGEGGRRKEQYSFTLSPEIMDKVEKEAAKHFRSASWQVDLILANYYENK